MNTYVKIGYLLRCARLARQFSTVLDKRPNFYELLGVSPKATAAEIKNAYFEKTKLYHPDAVASTEENLTLFRQISEAYEILGSPVSRQEYDENVLGISKEDPNDMDDPITLYRSKMNNEKMYSWTKEYCSTLRKQQYTYNTTSFNKPKQSHAKSDLKYSGFTVVSVVICLGLAIINVFYDDINEKIKKF